MKTQAPHPLFDTLLKEHSIKNDAQLCKVLEFQPPAMSKMRHGKLPISDSLRIAILRKFRGWSIKRLDMLAPPAGSDEAAQ